MKSLILVLLFISSVLFAQWTNIAPKFDCPDFNDLFYISSASAYVIGDSGYAAIIGYKDYYNSNISYRNMETTANLNSFFRYDESHYWIGGDGIVIIMSDLDSTRENVLLDPSISISQIYFEDKNKGYIVAGDGVFGSSVDGGHTWVSKVISNENLNGIAVTSDSGIYIAGDAGLLLKSTNSGLDWEKLAFPTSNNLTSIQITETGLGTITSKNIYSTTDFGSSWYKSSGVDEAETIYVTASSPSSYMNRYIEQSGKYIETYSNYKIKGRYPAATKVKNCDNGCIVGSNSYLASIQGHPVHNPVGNNYKILDSFFFSASEGVIFSSNGLMTTENGADWSINSYPGSGYLYNFKADFLDTKHGYISINGAFYYTDDGGINWQFKKQFTSEVGFRFINGSTGILADENKIYKTTDYGNTWDVIDYPPMASSIYSILGVHIIDDNMWFISCAPGILLRTSDSGNSWEQIAWGHLSPYDVKDVSSYDGELIVAVIAAYEGPALYPRGIVMKSTDGGINWEQTYWRNNVEFRSIYLHEGPYGLLGRDDGSLCKTFSSALDFTTIHNFDGISIDKIEVNEANEVFLHLMHDQQILYAENYFTATGIKNEPMTNVAFSLGNNYPNPFNPVTKISFTLRSSDHTTLQIFDILGNEIDTILDEYLTSGEHQTIWNAERFASGIYYYRLTSGSYVEVKKMILLK